jgi:protein-L-isoaspartate O-methyltransferase
MLNDSVRNDAYRAAIIRRVLQQGTDSSVLDIGTGTGILRSVMCLLYSLFSLDITECTCMCLTAAVIGHLLKHYGLALYAVK